MYFNFKGGWERGSLNVYDIITETRYDYYELFFKELEIGNCTCNFRVT